MIHILFTGGTISMRHDAASGGNLPRHGGAELLALAGVADGIACRMEDWARSPACHLDADRLWALRARVLELARMDDVEGIVITHGTDVLEETAYLLARTIPADVPVALTGAMRTADHPEWDGGTNLRAAIAVAGAPESRGRGAMVVFNGLVLDGLEAVKLHALDPAAFGAPHGAPLGRAGSDGVVFDRPASARRPLSPPALRTRVAQVSMILGDDGALLDAARAGADGIVLIAFGSGNIPPGAVSAVRRWIADGKPVVLASRCLYGEVVPAYAFDGGGAQLVRLGAIPAGPRTPSQARMELLISLAAGVPFGAAG
jgi:L-asparaginase